MTSKESQGQNTEPYLYFDLGIPLKELLIGFTRIIYHLMLTKLFFTFSVNLEILLIFEIKIKLNRKRLYPSTYMKYLGVLLDEHLLTFKKPHYRT